jgi:hypothetical protein
VGREVYAKSQFSPIYIQIGLVFEKKTFYLGLVHPVYLPRGTACHTTRGGVRDRVRNVYLLWGFWNLESTFCTTEIGSVRLVESGCLSVMLVHKAVRLLPVGSSAPPGEAKANPRVLNIPPRPHTRRDGFYRLFRIRLGEGKKYHYHYPFIEQ